MNRLAKQMAAATLAAGLALPAAALAADDVQQKLDALQKEITDLKTQVKKNEDKSMEKWLTIGGDYRFRVDSLIGEVPAHSSAIGTMMNLVNGFTAPTGVAGQTIGGFTSPTASQFIMQGKAGALFTPTQFNTILNQYMPQAMAAALPNIMTAMGSGAFNLQNTALTSQQQAVLSTLGTKVMPTVMAMQVGNIPNMQATLAGMGVVVPDSTTLQQVMAGFPAAQQQLLNQMLMQAFLGAAGPLNNNTTNLSKVRKYKPANDTLYTNKFGIDLHAKATKDVTVNVRLLAYKTFGSGNDDAVTGSGGNPYFADRVGVFDGTIGHIPSSDYLNVDRAYVTWANIAEMPVWFSVGRRPATNGVPSHLRLNNERPGNGGTPSLLVDYAFDGMTIGWAPDIEGLPGSYAKICYGRGFESGMDTVSSNSLKDTDMLGVAVVPVDTDPLRIHFQWNRGFNIFDFPVMENTFFGDTGTSTDLGDIDWYGAGVLSTLKKVGPGNLNLFAEFGASVTHPNENVSNSAGFQGLLTGQFFAQEAPTSKTGYGAFLGARYDFTPTNTKLGLEYNHGTKNWIPFSPAADDMWTTKVGTRGNVYEAYVIQDLNLKPISSYFSKAFFKIGYQYYDFEYTGSNNWVGAPQKISDIKSTDMFMLTPLETAQNAYLTFEVKF